MQQSGMETANFELSQSNCNTKYQSNDKNAVNLSNFLCKFVLNVASFLLRNFRIYHFHFFYMFKTYPEISKPLLTIIVSVYQTILKILFPLLLSM